MTINMFDDWDIDLRAMRDGDAEEHARFFTKLRASSFLVPMSPLENKGISLLSTQRKELFIPAFTTSAEFQKWKHREDGA
ncbi:MAG: SseB family protein, partial [Oscillospiraceae bacterium]|nr:SseB family protein [Oscillospiraceae bacterium]